MVVRSLASPGFSVLPDVVLPGEFTRDLEVPAQVAMLRDLPAEMLLTELEVITGGRPAPHWQGAVDDPKRWLHGYADLLQDAWSAMSPVWQQIRPLFDREVERVAVAAARRSLDVVLDDLHPGCSFHEETFSFPDLEPERFSIGSRGMVLMPMLAGPNALIARLDGPDAVWIGYPLPGLTHGLTAAPAGRHGGDLLAFVMGDVRSVILTSLDGPLTMGTLARRVQYAPNVVTYHCDRLESAGLIARRRQGREIYVHRTRRASILVELFAT
ncbi:Helix-turn-helix domain-containing protein [Nonomuraea jiangxiensis]|uniref:Helix-turn-helix domain-containing protein n=2 Tax=Nonomuraea jiangxiensis TaxID=633440 RepID=A0A1G9RPC0_9ACTN|nr:Helix-turn-helix domain-containing protein [Nonomuraea jiangxiensis]